MISIGDKFGRWTVKDAFVKKEEINNYHLCKCACGNTKKVLHWNLVRGMSKSCGCISSELASERKTHGMSGTRIYMTWNRMLSRCYNKKIDRYDQYGGRGIKVCDRWHKFENFYKDIGDHPGDGYSLGRVDNNKNYCPGNVEFQDAETQMNNTSRNIYIEHDGAIKTIAQWSRIKDISYEKLISRHNKGIKPPELFLKESMRDVFIEVDGVSLTVTKWMKKASIPISSYYHFKRKGLSSEDIVRKYLK